MRTRAGQTGTGKKRGRAEQMVLVEESCFILREKESTGEEGWLSDDPPLGGLNGSQNHSLFLPVTLADARRWSVFLFC